MKTKGEEKLLDIIIEGIKEKKGKEIVSIDISKFQGSICSHFVICHGDSTTQVNAIAQWIEKITEDQADEKVRRKQGYENSQWILLDYFDIVIHIFLKETRDFYNLEGLWGDGKIKTFEYELTNTDYVKEYE